MPAPVFISHSSRDGKIAQALCEALERRGTPCWISSRDVGPGENFQEAIVRALRRSSLMILVFSNNANNSNEIKKEIAIASQQKLVVIPVRVEDVVPSDAFAYELAIRQWIDLFADWDRALDRLVGQIRAVQAGQSDDDEMGDQRDPPAPPPKPRPIWPAAVAALVLLVAGGAYLARDRLFPPATKDNPPGRTVATNENATPTVAEQIQDAPKPATEQPPPSAIDERARNAGPGVQNAANDAPPSAMIDQSAPRPADARTPPDPTPDRKEIAPVAQVVDVGVAPPALDQVGGGGQIFQECETCPQMVVIPSGASMLGSPPNEAARLSHELPPTEVKIGTPFAVGRFDVSFEQWDACVAEGGCNNWRPGDYGWGRGRQPVIFVSWSDAQAYTAWLSQKTGKPYRLLTETEWEYAARGCRTARCVTSPFWFQTGIKPELANYDSRFSYGGSPKAQAARKTVTVDDGAANPFGLVHIIGNVRKWMADCWTATPNGYPAGAAARLAQDCRARAVRGGAWSDEPKELRGGARSWAEASERTPQIGFRVARSLTP